MLDPIVISPTLQEFDGVRYYKCGRYFQRDGVRLHRLVWERAQGPIPEGFHVHHINGDSGNNALSNLDAVSRSDHLGKIHGPASGARGLETIEVARLAASAWHGSEAGRAWHAAHYDLHIRPAMQRRVPATCEECGAGYMVAAARVAQGRFCGNNCKARALRKRRKSAKG
jgi:hypothetical protein